MVIVLLFKNSRVRNKYVEIKQSPIDKPNKGVQYQDLEGTKVMKSIELKEEKKKHKKEKTFLDE